MHDETAPESDATILGGRFHGRCNVLKPTQARVERSRKAFLWLARRPRITGRELERLVGHGVFLSLLNRSSLSIFCHVHNFIGDSYDIRTRLWSSVADECWLFAALLPLISADLSRGWSEVVGAVDACKSGIGISAGILSSETARRCGRWHERWRYKRLPPEEWKPRDRSIELAKSDSFDARCFRSDPDADPRRQPLFLAKGFSEVPDELLAATEWTTVTAKPMFFDEPIHMLEGRAVLLRLEQLASHPESHHLKHLLLSDNMSCILSLSKGRAADFGLLSICRKVAALSLSCNLALRVRWVRSEINPADAPSRLFLDPARPESPADRAWWHGWRRGCDLEDCLTSSSWFSGDRRTAGGGGRSSTTTGTVGDLRRADLENSAASRALDKHSSKLQRPRLFGRPIGARATGLDGAHWESLRRPKSLLDPAWRPSVK